MTEKGKTATVIHNDMNQNDKPPFNKIKSYAEEGHILYYYLSLTDLDENDNALMVFPGTNEVCSYSHAADYLFRNENYLPLTREYFLKQYILSEKNKENRK